MENRDKRLWKTKLFNSKWFLYISSVERHKDRSVTGHIYAIELIRGKVKFKIQMFHPIQ